MRVKGPCQHGDRDATFAEAGARCQIGTLAAEGMVRSQSAAVDPRRADMQAMLLAVGPDFAAKR